MQDWILQTRREMLSCSPETCVLRLCQLVNVRDQLDGDVYRSLMVEITVALYLKALKAAGAI